MDYASDEGKWSLYECLACEAQFWNPFKNPGNKWYEDLASYVVKKIEKPKVERGYHKAALQWLAESGTKPGTLLDLGCSTGEFIHEAQKLGWEVWGNDFDREAIATAKKAFGLKNLYSLGFEDFYKIPNLPRFDVVTFFEVLEHVDNPPAFVADATRLLKDSGTVIMSTPSRSRMLVNHIKADFPLHHLTRWNEKAAENLFARAGFTKTDARYVEQFKFLLDALSERLRFGLVQRTFKSETRTNNEGTQEKVVDRSGFTEIVHFFAHMKDYVIFGIPATILYAIGKLTDRKNGDMMLFFKKA